MVQRRIGQEQPELAIPWSDLVNDCISRSLAQKNDRPVHGSEQFARSFINLAKGARDVQVRNHYCKGLLDAVLAVTQQPDGCRIRGIGCEMKTSQALDGHDQSSSNGAR